MIFIVSILERATHVFNYVGKIQRSHDFELRTTTYSQAMPLCISNNISNLHYIILYIYLFTSRNILFGRDLFVLF